MFALITQMKKILMGLKFKCKRCKQKFSMAKGKKVMQENINSCEHSFCPLKEHIVSVYPKLIGPNLPETTVEKTIEVYEEKPIGALISRKDMVKKYGW